MHIQYVGSMHCSGLQAVQQPVETSSSQQQHTQLPPLWLLCCVQVVGNVMGLANHHSASRVIQWCLKEGSDADKAKLTTEVRANIVPLSKSKYGRFVVQKLINVAPKEEVPGGWGCLYGCLLSVLLAHRFWCAWVLSSGVGLLSVVWQHAVQ
jgi:hypothetical protein